MMLINTYCGVMHHSKKIIFKMKMKKDYMKKNQV